MATNDFKIFAGNATANVITQTEYLALAALIDGFTAGTANSAQLNKVWRQSSIMAAMLGDFIEQGSGNNVVDDGTTATILLNLLSALNKRNVGLDQSVAANVYALTLSPALSVTSLEPGTVVTLQSILNTSTGTATLNVNGTGALPIYKNGVALTGGELVLGDDARFQLNEAGTAWNLIFTTTGLFAAINGSASQLFQVAPGASNNDAINLGQGMVGGSPVDETANRSAGTTYTNSGTRWMWVQIGFTTGNSNTGSYITVTIGGNSYAFYGGSNTTGNGCFICAPVPVGAQYVFSVAAGSVTVSKWLEVK